MLTGLVSDRSRGAGRADKSGENLQADLRAPNTPVFHRWRVQTLGDLWLACLLLHLDASPPPGAENVLVNEVMKK